MPFSFRRRLDPLSRFYRSMKTQFTNAPIDIGTFDFEYNNVFSHVIFDTRENPFKLVFMRHGLGHILTLPVLPGFCLEINGDDLYCAFLDYFEIGRRGRGEYHISDFIYSLNKQTPESYELTDAKRRTVHDYDYNDGKGMFPIGLKNWEELNAERHARGLPDSGHRQLKNLEKTKNLYPELYAVVHNMDISVCYGHEPGANTSFLTGGVIRF